MEPKATRATNPLARFQERREATSRELLEAARRVIAFNGYYNTKITDIARAANVGVGTFYLYYPTKQAVFLELVEDAGRKLRAKLDAIRAKEIDPDQLVRESTDAFLHFAQDNRELFKIIFSHGNAFHSVVAEAQERFVADAITNIESGIRAGLFRNNRADVTAHALIGMTTQVVSWWLEHPSVPIEEVSASLMQIVFGGIGTDPPSGT